jgi:hypothetical protein
MTSTPSQRVIAAMDREGETFIARTRWFHEPMNLGRARMFVLQHRLNSRYRNSVLKLRVATNIPDWNRRLQSSTPSARRSSPTTSMGAAVRTSRF